MSFIYWFTITLSVTLQTVENCRGFLSGFPNTTFLLFFSATFAMYCHKALSYVLNRDQKHASVEVTAYTECLHIITLWQVQVYCNGKNTLKIGQYCFLYFLLPFEWKLRMLDACIRQVDMRDKFVNPLNSLYYCFLFQVIMVKRLVDGDPKTSVYYMFSYVMTSEVANYFILLDNSSKRSL